MRPIKTIVNSPYSLWMLLALPWIAAVAQYTSGNIFYGEFIHVTGEFSARLLILTMAVTPLRLAWPKARWSAWLVQRRRYLGVAAFAYAVPHLVAYLIKLGTWPEIIQDSLQAGIWTGWLALALFLPLALTSSNAAVRKLGRRWKALHRLVYLAAALTFAHWLLVAFDPVPGLIHLGILGLLEAYRVRKTHAAPRHA